MAINPPPPTVPPRIAFPTPLPVRAPRLAKTPCPAAPPSIPTIEFPSVPRLSFFINTPARFPPPAPQSKLIIHSIVSGLIRPEIKLVTFETDNLFKSDPADTSGVPPLPFFLSLDAWMMCKCPSRLRRACFDHSVDSPSIVSQTHERPLSFGLFDPSQHESSNPHQRVADSNGGFYRVIAFRLPLFAGLLP